jgi:hypothetical protein
MRMQKTCVKCGRSQHHTSFSWANKAKGVRQAMCKACFCEYNRVRYYAKHEELRAKWLAYYQKKREDLCAYQKRYVAQNTEKVRKRRAATYQRDKETVLAKSRAYAKANRDKVLERKRRYYRENREILIPKMKAYAKSPKGREVSRKTLQKQRRDNKERVYARAAVMWAIRCGTLTRPTRCEKCRSKCRPHAHHHIGYERKHWLSVQWLCPPCHDIAHGKTPRSTISQA